MAIRRGGGSAGDRTVLASAAARLAPAAPSIAVVGRRATSRRHFSCFGSCRCSFTHSSIRTFWAVGFFGATSTQPSSRNLSFAVAGTLSLPLQLLAWRGLLATVEPHPVPVITPRSTIRDVRAGYLTWFVVTPGVYVVGVLALWLYSRVGGKADVHPMVKLTESTTATAGVFLLVMAEALIAAPVREELLFRGILLPWLADRQWGGSMSLFLAAIVGVGLRPSLEQPWTSPLTFASRFGPALLVLAMTPLAYPLARWRPLRRILPIRDDRSREEAIRAIVGSAALFACVHSNVWPTPIPLAVLALALGWLAIRTQSVIAPIVMHMLFNTVAFVEMGLTGVN